MKVLHRSQGNYLGGEARRSRSSAWETNRGPRKAANAHLPCTTPLFFFHLQSGSSEAFRHPHTHES